MGYRKIILVNDSNVVPIHRDYESNSLLRKQILAELLFDDVHLFKTRGIEHEGID